MRILEEFAKGNISPEPRFFRRDSHYGRMIKILSESEEKLLAALGDDELKDTLKQLTKAQTEISYLTGIDKFVYGFRLGVILTTEVFDGKENLFGGEEHK